MAGATAIKPHEITAEESRNHRTLFQDAMRRFSRNRLAIIGSVIVLILVILAVFADYLAPYHYSTTFFREGKVRLFPFVDPAHILGTDAVGRDYLSRLIYGARTSLTVGIAVQLVAVLIGVPLGGIAGYRGGLIDFLFLQVIRVMTAFPGLMFAILLVTVMDGGVMTVIFALSVTSWIGIARLTRAQILSLREKEYIEASRCLGVRESSIIFKHLLPNALTPILVAISFGIPGAIFGEAGLSFLGIGINDPLASWGQMVGVSTSEIRVYWHLGLFPTFAIALTMLGFTFIGDGLRDALDPRMLE